ncbi:MAG: septum formation initiator family protein [Clostridia bacterium]|nr:septum formation initiator family protein [Clostridia bacterium]
MFSLVGFAIVFVVAICSFISLGNARRKSANYDALITSLQKQEAELKAGVENVSSPAYLEEQARNQYGMLKEGETLYIYTNQQ